MAFEWFERDDYPSILEVMVDKHRLPPTFDEWEKNADAGVRALEAAGHVIVPILIKPDPFVKWCEANGSRPDARGRLKFCNMQHRQSSPSQGVEHDASAQALSSTDVIEFAASSRGHGADDRISTPRDTEPPARAKPESKAPGALGRLFELIGLVQSALKRFLLGRRH